jgi:Enterobacterial TraT complement resistance protein
VTARAGARTSAAYGQNFGVQLAHPFCVIGGAPSDVVHRLMGSDVMTVPCFRLFPFALALLLSGCAATTTAIGKRKLDVQTRMSHSVFLEPVAASERTVLVEVRNSSDRADLDIAPAVRAALAQRGYRLVDHPKDARFLLQANVLQVGRTSRAVAGAAASAAADAFVQDVTYSITTNVQVAERAGEGVMVTERMSQDLTQGSGGRRILSTSEVHDWKRYQTRIMSSANQVNLDLEEAAPELVAGLTRAIAGIF